MFSPLDYTVYSDPVRRNGNNLGVEPTAVNVEYILLSKLGSQ